MRIEGYKCPNCAGAVSFDSGAQKMKCPYCDAEFDIAALEELQKEIEGYGRQEDVSWDVDEQSGEEWAVGGNDGLLTGVCPVCSAELVGDANTIAAVCPCCGSAQIVARQIAGMLKPDYVIPFRHEKDAAVNALKEFCRNKRLLPDNYLEEKRVRDMQGVYVPFWLFDAKAQGHVRYKATKLDPPRMDSNYTYITTRHFSIVRDGVMNFEKIPADASQKMSDEYMDALEPFDYGKKVDFHQSYLAGYLAEKYDVEAKDCRPRADRRIKTSIETEFRKSVRGYATLAQEAVSVKIREAKTNYALFPVWVFNTKFQDENYRFMMNGQTGKLVGRLPVDNSKVWRYRSTFFAIFALVLTPIVCVLDLSFRFFENVAAIFAEGLSPDSFDIPLWALLPAAWALCALFGGLIVRGWRKKMDTVTIDQRKHTATDYAKGAPDYSVQKDTYLYSRVTRIPKASARSGSRR